MSRAPALTEEASSPLRRRRTLLQAVLVSLRPTQWTKNFALLAAPIFARRITEPLALGQALQGVAAFCLLASAAYLANDIVDRENDRLHPRKRWRPIAAGELPVPLAAGVGAALALVGLLLALGLGRNFLAAAGAYVALQAAYSVALKKVVLLDVFGLALGFVLRVVAGGEAVGVEISSWLYLCSFQLALFLALAKRRAELVHLAADAPGHRRILADYTTPLLDQLITVLSACTVLAYALYTRAPETVVKFGTDRLKFTVPFVLFGLFRYLYLVHRRSGGEQPELVLLFDRPTQLNLAAYLLVVAWAIYL